MRIYPHSDGKCGHALSLPTASKYALCTSIKTPPTLCSSVYTLTLFGMRGLLLRKRTLLMSASVMTGCLFSSAFWRPYRQNMIGGKDIYDRGQIRVCIQCDRGRECERG